MPGPQRPLFALRSQLVDVHPFVPLAADHAVGIAIFSYNGLITFGISADLHSTPDLEVLVSGIEAGLDELRALTPGLEKTLEEMRN